MIDLPTILSAELMTPVTVELTISRSEVSIQRMLRRESRHSKPVPRDRSCWAPNKPAIAFRGGATFAELVIVHLLEEAGWEARWIKHWTGRREFCTDAGVARAMPAGAAARFAAIHERAAALRGAGSWDIFGWRRDDYVFIESKQHRSSDRLNKNQLAWLEAALESGVSVDSFAVVEYDASRPTRQNERLVGELRAPDLHEET